MGKTLTIRDWTQADMQALAEFHKKMVVGYDLPETFGPLYVVRKVVCDETGRPVVFGTVKLTAEAMFFTDPEIPSAVRARGFRLLHEECEQTASKLGLDDVSCWIPPHIAKWFAKIVQKMGWKRSPWRNWSYLLK